MPYTSVLGGVGQDASRKDACAVLHHVNVYNGSPETEAISSFLLASPRAPYTQELVNFNGGRVQPQSLDPKHMLVFRVEIGGHMVGCACRSVDAASHRDASILLHNLGLWNIQHRCQAVNRKYHHRIAGTRHTISTSGV